MMQGGLSVEMSIGISMIEDLDTAMALHQA